MEDFIPYKLAVKLVEKGFNYETRDIYERNTLACRYEDVPKPTISQVLKWLREKDIMVFPVYSTNTSRWYCSIVNADSLDTYRLTLSDSYELAAIAGIKYCLDNLI
jgi:hypothetical protein